MEIVPMVARHLPLLEELERQCFSRPWSRQALEEELYNENACFLVAVEESCVLGYIGMHFAGGECYMDNLAVFPSHRKKGVGAYLLKALMKAAEDMGAELLSLEVRPSNSGAVGLYLKHGFAEEGRRPGFYSAPKEDALILTKRF